MNMNLLGNQFSYRGSLKSFQMRVHNETRRVFGKDITNLQRKSKNQSIYEKPCPKIETKQTGIHTKLRARSLNSKKESSEKIDAIYEYSGDILRFMGSLQKREFDDSKSTITQKMRQILIDWLVDVHESFQLKQQTLYLALSYLNRFAATVQISKEEYQLAGTACLWIASKYQEIYPPRMNNYVEVTANTYSIQQLKNMEGRVMCALDFELNTVTPLAILEATQADSIMSTKMTSNALSLCKYIIQLGLLQNLGKKYSPAVMVLASISLADSIYKTKTDICNLRECLKQYKDGVQVGKIPKQEILACFKDMCSILHNGNKYSLKALKRKYMKEKYHKVSNVRLESK